MTMAQSGKPTASGLEGVVVAETAMSEVDGERGRLVIGGYEVEALAGTVGFEDVCHLLWKGRLPSPEERSGVVRALGGARKAAWELVPRLGDALRLADGMDALRAAVAHLTASNTGREGEEVEVVGAFPVFVAAWARLSRGKEPVAPDPELSAAADYLRMTRGEPAPEPLVGGLQTYLVAVSDHGMNASTFTARVVASTGSDIVSSLVAAIGALKGPLHGGAPGPVLDMLDAVGKPENAIGWLESELQGGKRIMGMGHRIYRVRDPRAAVLEKGVERLEKAGTKTGRLPLARAVEQAACQVLAKKYPNRSLQANVEFYTAVLLEAVGLPREMFAPTFAVGRAAGWAAHVAEQRRAGKLIRPASNYVGEARSST